MALFTSYYTLAYVEFKSSRLARTYYFLLLLLLLYSGFSLVWERGYLEYDEPAGVLRLRLKSPELDQEQDLAFIRFLQKQYDRPFVEWDEFDAVAPSPQLSEQLFITTEVSDVVERYVVDDGRSKWKKVHTHHFFVKHPDEFILKLEHTMFAKKFYEIGNGEEFAESSRHMDGFLVKLSAQTQPETIREFKSGKADSMPVKDLLLAAGLDDLDAPSDAVGHEDETFRERGLVLYVHIKYSNLASMWGTRQPTYEYRVERLPETGYKVAEELSSYPHRDWQPEDPFARYRFIRRRHGIFIKVEQGGKLGRFSWQNTLFHIASIMSLLAVITSLVDFMAGYVPQMTNSDFDSHRCVVSVDDATAKANSRRTTSRECDGKDSGSAKKRRRKQKAS